MFIIFNFNIFLRYNLVIIWQKMQINLNVVQLMQKIQKRKKEYCKRYGVSFLDATVINIFFIFYFFSIAVKLRIFFPEILFLILFFIFYFSYLFFVYFYSLCIYFISFVFTFNLVISNFKFY